MVHIRQSSEHGTHKTVKTDTVGTHKTVKTVKVGIHKTVKTSAPWARSIFITLPCPLSSESGAYKTVERTWHT